MISSFILHLKAQQTPNFFLFPYIQKSEVYVNAGLSN